MLRRRRPAGCPAREGPARVMAAAPKDSPFACRCRSRASAWPTRPGSLEGVRCVTAVVDLPGPALRRRDHDRPTCGATRTAARPSATSRRPVRDLRPIGPLQRTRPRDQRQMVHTTVKERIYRGGAAVAENPERTCTSLRFSANVRALRASAVRSSVPSVRRFPCPSGLRRSRGGGSAELAVLDQRLGGAGAQVVVRGHEKP